MAKWWIELLQSRSVEEHGRVVNRNPGEWVSVGRQLAEQWIAEGAAWVPDAEPTGIMPGNSGVLFLGGVRGNSKSLIEHYGGALMWQEGAEPTLPWTQTFVWDATFKLRMGLIPNGFGLLQRWQIAVPIWKYDELALHLGSPEERQRTKEIIHDLRVMAYDTRCMFIKRCTDTERLIEIWAEERRGGCDKLAFLRALYMTKPLICALPISWGGGGEG